MKKIIAGAAMLVAVGSAFADNSHRMGNMALGFDSQESDMITGKYMVSDNLALTGGVAFGSWGGDASGTDIAFKVGARSYMNQDDFSPFVGGHFGYSSYLDGDVTSVEFVGEFGAEYFFAKNFSVEGTAGVGYRSQDTKTPAGTVTANRLGTERAGIGFNFYF